MIQQERVLVCRLHGLGDPHGYSGAIEFDNVGTTTLELPVHGSLLHHVDLQIEDESGPVKADYRVCDLLPPADNTTLRIEPAQPLTLDNFPLLQTIQKDRWHAGSYWVRAVLTIGEIKVFSNSVELLLRPEDCA